MGQNAPTPQDKNCGTVHCDRNSDAPGYKTALKLQIYPKKSTFGGFLLKIFPKFERTGQKVPHVSIITAAGTVAALPVVIEPRVAIFGKECSVTKNPNFFATNSRGMKIL